MNLAFPVVHLGIDRAVDPCRLEDRKSLVELAGVSQGEGVLPEQGRVARRQDTGLGGQPHPTWQVPKGRIQDR